MSSLSNSTLQPFKGLLDKEVLENRLKYGPNILEEKEQRPLLSIMKNIVLEPMFLLLLVACTVYFMLFEVQEGIVLLIALLLVAGISLYQEYRSRNAIHALNKLSASKARVIRNGIMADITTEDIVYGDILLLKEGEVVAADGVLRQANDLFLNESILTGESFPVHKKAGDHSFAYKGTLVSSGSAIMEVTAVGKETQFGKIGLQLAGITAPKTPMQLQISSFVRNMAIVGILAFGLVFLLQYIRTADGVMALLAALTLAMSILPEEIPVAFSTFQALGAFRLLREKIIVKHPQYVETLGAATVICADKTGTITQNRMRIAMVYDASSNRSYETEPFSEWPEEVVTYAMWASESQPFDPMEKAIHSLYKNISLRDERPTARQIHEYPLSGIPPFMTHIFYVEGQGNVVASKGAPESIIRLSTLSNDDKHNLLSVAKGYAIKGYRVLGVGKGIWHGQQWPLSHEEFVFEFLGLIAFEDPPKENIAYALEQFKNAGIAFKMITGDYPETAVAVAEKIGIDHGLKVLTGNEVMEADDAELQKACIDTSIFARMFPEAKLRVIDALKKQGHVVAMTGDGVNDAPALKASHIGIAMGQRGSEVAKSAASLILVDDDLVHMVEAVAQGRKIYDNLKKAIRYIISIHIPIILVVLIPLLLGWSFTSIFSPVHVIFLELIMGPTCSIIYENEPIEPGTMKRKPRVFTSSFLSMKQLFWSILQGLCITAGVLGLGYYLLSANRPEELIRTMIFITLLFSNLFLTWINRSFQNSIFTTYQYDNPLMLRITLFSACMVGLFLFVPFLRDIFELSILTYNELFICLLVSLVSTMWFEGVKISPLRSKL